MSQIFVFTAGNPEARQHLVESIENQIDEKPRNLRTLRLHKRKTRNPY